MKKQVVTCPVAESTKMQQLNESQSQIGQESFVQHILGGKRQGYYVEIGAFDPVLLSNTLVLENGFEWSGVSLEIESQRTHSFNDKRRNKCLTRDATACDYEEILDRLKFPTHIDYLQVDIEPPRNTFKALKRVLKTGRTFGVVTFEHDLYATIQNRIWKFLGWVVLVRNGYRRVISNVSNEEAAMEDWYAHRTIATTDHFPSNLDWKCYFKGVCSHHTRL